MATNLQTDFAVQGGSQHLAHEHGEAPARKVMGFFTDTTLCIGCKACEVACKQWNQLPDDGFLFSGMSYDNTAHLGASTWRHVAFIERSDGLPGQGSPRDGVEAGAAAFGPLRPSGQPASTSLLTDVAPSHIEMPVPLGPTQRALSNFSWLMMSDVCKHCERAARLEGGMVPACAKACPTASIQFGDVGELRDRAEQRVEQLRARGVAEARLYGEDAAHQPGTEGLHAFFLLCDEPEVYNLPPDPVVPTKKIADAWYAMAASGVGLAAICLRAVASGGRRSPC